MLKRSVAIACLASTLVGCANLPTPAPSTYTVQSAFDAEYARQQMEPGEGSVSGTAFMRQQGGGVVTCAGSEVHLFPVTEYAAERLYLIYGKAPELGEIAFRDASTINPHGQQFIPDPPEYRTLAKQTVCDAQGNFEFTDIKDGDYFISVGVIWLVRYPQGGFLSTRISVKNGESPRIIMSR